MKIGYVPYDLNFKSPGDYRRFIAYASSVGLEYEIANFDCKYDVLVVTGNADLSQWVRYPYNDTYIVFDFIDSYLSYGFGDLSFYLRGIAKYISRSNKYLHFNYSSLIERMIRRSNVVTCASQKQYSELVKYGVPIVDIFDDQSSVVQKMKDEYIVSRPVKIVWEGLPSNLYHLYELLEPLKCICKKHEIELHVVTDLYGSKWAGLYGYDVQSILSKWDFDNIVLHEWNIDTFSEIICSCDIAIVPTVKNDCLAEGKPANKLFLLWRHKLPVVTSDIVSYKNAMKGAGLDLFCSDSSEWVVKITELIEDIKIRKLASSLGYKYAIENSSKIEFIERWDRALSYRS